MLMRRVDVDHGSELLSRYRAGDPEAARVIQRRYVPLMRAAALRVARNPHAAEDVVQEVLTRLLSVNPDTKTSLAAHLTMMAVNEARTYHRRRSYRDKAHRKFQSEAGADEPAVDMFADLDPVEAEEVRHVLDSLLPSYRRILSLFYFDRRSHEEIAAMERVPVGTSRSRLSTALTAFKRAWTKRLSGR